MFFLGGPQNRAGRRQFVFRAATLTAGLLVSVATLSGCGGSSSKSGGSSSNTPATVSGRFIDNNTSDNISGVVVKFGTLTATTGASGQFSFSVPANSAATTLTATFPVDSRGLSQYYSVAYIGGQQYNIVNGGYQVVASQLTSGASTNIGDIRVFNTNDPPPPPTF